MFDIKELERIITENQAKTVEVAGRTFIYGKVTEIKEPKYRHEELRFEELSSIVTMIKNDADLTDRRLYINVENPYSVKVFTSEDKELERDFLYSAVFRGKQFTFGQWLDYENFIISLRAKFIDTDERNKLLALIASVKNVENNEISDNGITQTASTKKGALVENGDVKAIFRLTPYRTFNEVEQAAAEYLFRIKKCGNDLAFAIFEADGGKWELTQKQFIVAYLAKALEKEVREREVIIVS